MSLKININLPSNKLSKIIDVESLMKIYNSMRNEIKTNTCSPIVLHDGPPYANGNIHIGHILNKSLKDRLIRSQILKGKDVSFILGWDCHGLPIENKVLDDLRVNQQTNELVKDKNEIRTLCAKSARYWMEKQSEEFKNILVNSNSDVYYTNDWEYSKVVVQTLLKFVENNLVSRKKMPNWYSISEKTNLAFSELEYKDVENFSYTFKVKVENNRFLLIWTTQPWTIMSNEFICINDQIVYGEFEENNERLIASKKWIENRNIEKFKIISVEEIKAFKYEITKIKSGRKSIYINNELVNDENGTGLVHCAPAHGFEDYEFFIDENLPLEISNAIFEDGYFVDERLKNHSILENGNEAVIDLMTENNATYSVRKLEHRYPISWRNKKPVFAILSSQIVLNIDDKLINKIVDKSKEVNWFGKEGQNTFESTIRSRKEAWCISRQRTWGTPCAIFYNNATGQILCDKELNNSIVNKIGSYGCQFWLEDKVTDALLIKHGHCPKKFTKCMDTLDVWFDSGCSLLYLKKELQSKEINIDQADFYVEGKDQHRGWFNSSSIIYCLVNDILPFKNVITHGFLKTIDNEKVSKSNKESQKISDLIMKEHIEIVRIMLFSSDYGSDIPIGIESLSNAKTFWLKVYNSVRYGINMSYLKNEKLENFSYSTIDKYIAQEVNKIFNNFKANSDMFDFTEIHKDILKILKVHSDYIKYIKNILYCSKPNSMDYQASLNNLINITEKICYMCYTLMPATICFIYNKWLNIATEERTIELLRKTENQEILTINFEERKLIDYAFEIQLELNKKIDAWKKDKLISSEYEIGVYIEDKIEDYETIRKIISCSIVDVDKNRNSFDPIMYEFVIDKKTIIVVNLNKRLKKCQKCWRYNTQDILCDSCEKT